MGFLSDLGSIAKELQAIKGEFKDMRNEVVDSVMNAKDEFNSVVSDVTGKSSSVKRTPAEPQDDEDTTTAA